MDAGRDLTAAQDHLIPVGKILAAHQGTAAAGAEPSS